MCLFIVLFIYCTIFKLNDSDKLSTYSESMQFWIQPRCNDTALYWEGAAARFHLKINKNSVFLLSLKRWTVLSSCICMFLFFNRLLLSSKLLAAACQKSSWPNWVWLCSTASQRWRVAGLTLALKKWYGQWPKLQLFFFI